VAGRRRLAGFGRITEETVPTRCDTVAFDETAAFRCRYRYPHYGPCNFYGARNGDGICMARLLNFNARRMRFCFLPEDHDGDHIFLWVSEQDAYRETLRLPEHPHIGIIVVKDRPCNGR
jgi:hypothetical protein